MELITLIASHINCTEKLAYFMKLLTGINNQIDYDTMDIRISLSYGENISLDELKYVVNAINKNNFKFYFQESFMSQFEHYKYLTNTITDKNNTTTWILFSNDDDEWADNRLAAYHHMINCLPNNDYELTSTICYADTESIKTRESMSDSPGQGISNDKFIGNYTNYCIKLKYLEIFFKHATDSQLNHEYCDYYFVKFMNLYGSGKLKRAFSSTDDVLYESINHDNYVKSDAISLDECIMDNLNLYMAIYHKPKAKSWLKFCIKCLLDANNIELSTKTKLFAIKLYLDKYQDHLFADKNLPVYCD